MGMAPTTAFLVFNPGSGKGTGNLRAKTFAEAWLLRPGHEIRLRETRSREDIRVAAREAFADPEVVPVFMGGDGTLSECLQGAAEARDFDPIGRPVAFLPSGTGNSFLRDFGILGFEAAMEAFFEAFDDGVSTAIDAALIHYRTGSGKSPEVCRVMFNLFGVGLISDITELAVRMRSLGSWNYRVATVAKIFGHRPYHFFLTTDGETETVKANLVTVSNSRFTGGDMEIAPSIRVNDGRLFLAVTSTPRRLDLFRLFPKLLKGNYEGESRVTTQFVKRLVIGAEGAVTMNIDGELETGYEPRLEVVPSYFRLWLRPERLVE